MPLYEITAVAAKDNLFVRALFLYRKKRLEIEQLREMNEGENNSEIADACWAAMGEYQKAIQYAIRTANSDNQNKAEQKDFRDWLCWNRKIIMGVFLELSNTCAAVSEPEKADLINDQLIKYDREIVLLIDANEVQSMILPSGFDGKKAELDQAKAILERKPNKLAVSENYPRRFYDFLNTLIQHKLLETWYKEESNYNWLQEHCLLLGTIVQNLSLDKQVEFEQEWANFLNANKLLESEEERKIRLDHVVEQSIVLCFQWEKMTALEKVQAELQRFIENVRERLADAKKKVKSVAGKVRDVVGTFFGTLLWPIIAPTLLVVDKLAGTESLGKYNGFLKENLIKAGKFAYDHPFITAGIVIGAVGGIVAAVLTGGSFAIFSSMAVSSAAAIGESALISGLVVGGLTIASAAALHHREIVRVEEKHKKEIEELKGRYQGIMIKKEDETKEQLMRNRNIHKGEKNKEDSDEVKEMLELRAQQQARAKQKEETRMQNQASEIKEKKKEKEKEKGKQIIANIQDLLGEMNPEDIQLAEEEYKEVLAKAQEGFTEIAKQRALTEKQLQQEQFELNKLDADQQKIRDELEAFSQKKQATTSSSMASNSGKMIEVKFNEPSSAKRYQSELLKIGIDHLDRNMRGRGRKIEFLSEDDIYLISLSTQEYEVIESNEELYAKLLNIPQIPTVSAVFASPLSSASNIPTTTASTAPATNTTVNTDAQLFSPTPQ